MTGSDRPARIVVGVAGGIAAYKSALLVRLFTEAGHHVHVVPTATALKFVGAPTWEALSGNRVHTNIFDGTSDVMHVRLGRESDLVVVSPATADLMARAAGGHADDMLTGTLLTTTKPVLFVPAMHTEMWNHPATEANVATLRQRGNVVLDPAVGRLTGKDSGAGRLPEPEDIFSAAQSLLRGIADGREASDLAGKKVVISAGGTREALDPVRYLGNRSTGHQGFALAQAAVARGAEVHVIAANVDLPTPLGVDRIDVESAVELKEAMATTSRDADVVIMAAAVADYRPKQRTSSKMKKDDSTEKSGLVIELEQNPDILAGLVSDREATGVGAKRIIGFAAETGDETGTVLEHGQRKAQRKCADLLIINQVGENIGFGAVDSAVTVITHDGDVVAQAAGTKRELADSIWDAIQVSSTR